MGQKLTDKIEARVPTLFYKILIGFVKIIIFIFFRSLYLNLTVSPDRKGEYHCWLYKLLSGIVILTLSCLIIFKVGVEGIEVFEKHFKNYLLDYFSLGIAENISGFVGFIIMVSALIWFVKGTYRIKTFYYYSPVFESGSGLFNNSSSDLAPSQSNIDRAISYRNSRLAGLPGFEAADLLTRTSVLDSIKNGTLGNDPEVQRSISYLDSKLCTMSGFDGVDYLAGKK